MIRSVFLIIFVFVLLMGCSDNCSVDMSSHSFENPQSVPNFKLESVFGKSELSNEDLYGQYVVLDFFFTKCPSICPKMSGNMKRIQQELSDLEGFSLVSISIDEKRDTRSTLREYAQRFEADTNRWSFLRGSRDDVFGFATALKMGVSESEAKLTGGFEHSGTFLVISPDGKVTYHVKGDGSEDHEIDDLICFLKSELTH